MNCLLFDEVNCDLCKSMEGLAIDPSRLGIEDGASPFSGCEFTSVSKYSCCPTPDGYRFSYEIGKPMRTARSVRAEITCKGGMYGGLKSLQVLGLAGPNDDASVWPLSELVTDTLSIILTRAACCPGKVSREALRA